MRYQQGSIELVPTAQGLCYYIRFTVDGKRPRFRIGLKSQLKTESAASRAAQHIRDRINSPAIPSKPRTFGEAIARYEDEEMPTRYSTRRGYMQIHRLYLLPKWGRIALPDVNPMEMRAWILAANTLEPGWKEKKEPLDLPDLSPRTLGHIHGQMRVLFRFSMLWGWMPAAVNPMSLFKITGGTKRTRKPRVITPAQFRQLLKNEPDIRIRTMYIGAYCLGLRVSELFGLKWEDFDHFGSKVHIGRAIVDGRVGPVKTERSDAPLPLAEAVGAAFLAHRQRSIFKEDGDWVFASEALSGKRPSNSQHIQFNTLRDSGKAIGLDFNLGWHTFRHSYKVLLERSGADITVQRDLMRHADTHTTSQVYGEVEMDRMRAANDRAVALAFGEE